MASSIVAPGFLGLLMDIFSHPALFYGAAVSFIIAFGFLKAGSYLTRSGSRYVSSQAK
jgi:hypothetical protein